MWLLLLLALIYPLFRFKEKYEYKILRGNEKVASNREKYIGSTVAKVNF